MRRSGGLLAVLVVSAFLVGLTVWARDFVGLGSGGSATDATSSGSSATSGAGQGGSTWLSFLGGDRPSDSDADVAPSAGTASTESGGSTATSGGATAQATSSSTSGSGTAGTVGGIADGSGSTGGTLTLVAAAGGGAATGGKGAGGGLSNGRGHGWSTASSSSAGGATTGGGSGTGASSTLGATRASSPSGVSALTSGSPLPFSAVALFATNSINVNMGARVTGSAVVNVPATTPTLWPGFELALQRDAAVTGSAKADRFQLNRNASVSGDVAANVFDDKGGTIGAGPFPFTPPAFDPVPPFQAASVRPTAPNRLVPANDTLTLPPGEYGDVTIAQGGTLKLTGGRYDIRSIAPVSTAGGQCPFPCRSLVFDGPADVRIVGNFDMGKDAKVEPTGTDVAPHDAILYVGGGLATVGQGSRLKATVYGAGLVRVDKSSQVTGALLGRDVLVERDSTVVGDSFFQNRPPTADPQSVATSGAEPLLITLTGSDPENQDLAFSIVSGPSEGTLTPPDPDPVIPDPIEDPDNPGTFVQPPITSATVTYMPATAGNLADSFVFKVTDPQGAMGTATVDINPPGDPTTPPVVVVAASDVSAETTPGTPVVVPLQGSAPAGVTLSFVVTTLPAQGSLSAGAAIESVPYTLPSPTVTYTPGSGFTGSDSFQYRVDGSNGVSSAEATATIGVSPLVELAEDQTVTTDKNQPVQVTLTGNPGGTGTQSFTGSAFSVSAFSAAAASSGAALPGATIAGNVSDANGDGLGDGRDNLPGPAPVLVAAGVDVNLGATPAGSVTDPAGDATNDTRVDPDPDLVSATVSSDGTNLNLSVRFAAGTFNASLSRASFVLDTDENPATGFPGVDAANNDSALMGVEFLVNIGANLGANAEVLKFISPPNNFSNVGSFAATVVADGYDVAIPLSTLNDDGRMTFKVETQSFLGPGFTGILDYMPNLGLAPGQSRAGVQGIARIQIEWDITSLTSSADIASATVQLFTEKGTVDSLDTFFFAGTADQDGLLDVSDFQAPASPLPNVVMPVPPGAQTGDQGTFSFIVTDQLKLAVDQGRAYFSAQGRVNEALAGQGFKRGLQVRSTADGNLAVGKEPQLVVVPAGGPALVWTVQTLPPNGTLRTLAGVPVSAGQIFTQQPTLVYTPNFNFSGTDTFNYQVAQGLVTDTALVSIIVSVNDPCVLVGRDLGCTPGGS